MHVPFQSTSFYNIYIVNVLNTFQKNLRIKEHRHGYQKRRCIIEWIPACEIYLKTYNNVNIIDHTIKQSHIWLVLWKQWVSDKCHAQNGEWHMLTPCTRITRMERLIHNEKWMIQQNFPVFRASEFKSVFCTFLQCTF